MKLTKQDILEAARGANADQREMIRKAEEMKFCCDKCADGNMNGLNGKCWCICHKAQTPPKNDEVDAVTQRSYANNYTTCDICSKPITVGTLSRSINGKQTHADCVDEEMREPINWEVEFDGLKISSMASEIEARKMVKDFIRKVEAQAEERGRVLERAEWKAEVEHINQRLLEGFSHSKDCVRCKDMV